MIQAVDDDEIDEAGFQTAERWRCRCSSTALSCVKTFVLLWSVTTRPARLTAGHQRTMQ